MKDNCLLDSKKMEHSPGTALHFIIVDLVTYFTSSNLTITDYLHFSISWYKYEISNS